MILPTYPAYDLYDYEYHTEIKTKVRLQRKSDDKWFLVPVSMQNDYPKYMTAKQRKEGLLQTIKHFHNECYKCMLFYIIPEDSTLHDSIHGRPIGGELDSIQITERERLDIRLHE